MEEPAKNKKNAKERTKKQLDKHLLVENEYARYRHGEHLTEQKGASTKLRSQETAVAIFG